MVHKKLDKPLDVDVRDPDVDIDDDDLFDMNDGAVPIHKKESKKAYDDLDNPQGPQQALPLNVVPKKIIRHCKPPLTQLGQMFRMERAKKGYTHDQIAKLTGLDRREVGRLEQGIPAVPKIDRVMKLVDLYGMDVKTIKKVLGRQIAQEKTRNKSKEDTQMEAIDRHHTPEVEAILNQGTVPANEKQPGLSVSKEKMIKIFSDILKRKSPEEISDIASRINLAVTPGPSDTFIIKLSVYCSLCKSAIKYMSISSHNSDMLLIFCDECKVSSLVPYSSAMEKSIEKKEAVS
jgi:transcriptional regulator with XRE-family HTH domain